MEFQFTLHAKLKLQERNITEEEVVKIIKSSKEYLLDKETGNLVAYGVREKSGHILIVVLSPDMKKIITLIDTSKGDIINKRKDRGRWIKI